MRSKLFSVLVLIVTSSVFAHAEERKCPYEAIVELDGEYVRSGQGTRFYATEKLRKGDRVTVLRHDPGGWCMIAPPAGSFSWIRAEHVRKSDDGQRGALISNNVVVHIGSALNADEITTIQGNLSKGDSVTILGEKMFPFEEGQKLMYKISPIRLERRWILRKAIVPADAIQAEPFPGEAAPRKKPPGPVAEQIEPDPNTFAQPISTSETLSGPENSPRLQKARGANSLPNAVTAESGSFRDRLDLIDQQFRTMIKQEPSTWNLKEIEQKYTELENEATLPSQGRIIASRLDAVSRYEKTHGEYLAFLKMSEESKQRDAKLAALQEQHDAEARALSHGATQPPPQPQLQPQLQPQMASADAQQGPPANGPPANGPTMAPQAGNPGGTPDPGRPAAPPAFVGAGLVTPMARTFPGGPQYALVAPGGKLLAYLVPAAGIDLRRAINQSMGIIGERSFRQEWGADVIVVRGIQPVQLRASR